MHSVNTDMPHTWMSWHGRGWTWLFSDKTFQSLDQVKWADLGVSEVETKEQERWGSLERWICISKARTVEMNHHHRFLSQFMVWVVINSITCRAWTQQSGAKRQKSSIMVTGCQGNNTDHIMSDSNVKVLKKPFWLHLTCNVNNLLQSQKMCLNRWQ